MSAGERLRAAREQAGLSVSQAAHLLRLRRAQIQDLESGRVAWRSLTYFARLYGVSHEWLAWGVTRKLEPREKHLLLNLPQEERQRLETLLKTMR